MSGGFGPQHLPYGALLLPGDDRPRLAVRVGAQALDLSAATRAGRFDGVAGADVLTASTLNPLLAQPPEVWHAVRARVLELVDDGRESLLDLSQARTCLPFEVADYVDFYSSRQHATNLSRILRPEAPRLPAAWEALPIGYHGRAGTVVVDGSRVRRPVGHRFGPDGEVLYGPCADLDIELELGFVTGGAAVTPIDLDQADELIFGVVLLNDWSARDLQRFEYVPLGPFLAKSFATSVGAWVTPLAALAGARVPAPEQDPRPQGRLAGDRRWLLDLDLQVELRPAGTPEYHVVSRTSSRNLHWTFAQQLVHAASNGASVRPGDLFGTGTISGEAQDSRGSLIELSWNRQRPLDVGGARRSFLEDGDSVRLRGSTRDGLITLGSVEGTVVPA